MALKFSLVTFLFFSSYTFLSLFPYIEGIYIFLYVANLIYLLINFQLSSDSKYNNHRSKSHFTSDRFCNRG